MKKAAGLFSMTLALVSLMLSCGQVSDSQTSSEDNAIPEVEVVVEETWLIDEHRINDIPLTTAASQPMNTPEQTGAATNEKKEMKSSDQPASSKNMEVQKGTVVEENDAVVSDGTNTYADKEYKVYNYATVSDQLNKAGYVEVVEDIELQEAVIPMDEKQTIVSFNNKGKEKAAFQVVSNPDGDIEYIAFTDKKHKDIYDISAGITGKEAKQLRKELKHMVHKGKIFLYDDESNIMYLMSAKDKITGDNVTAADVESMEVSSIIWKDKKSRK